MKERNFGIDSRKEEENEEESEEEAEDGEGVVEVSEGDEILVGVREYSERVTEKGEVADEGLDEVESEGAMNVSEMSCFCEVVSESAASESIRLIASPEANGNPKWSVGRIVWRESTGSSANTLNMHDG